MRTIEHSLQMAAGLNWHLFETVELLKYESGETISLSLADRFGDGGVERVFCSEQMLLATVPKPDMSQKNLVTYGRIANGKIGYIYVYGWFWEVESELLEAVQALMFDQETIGLIIDFRLNFGGSMSLSDAALALLFNESVTTVGFSIRGESDDHLDMVPAPDGPPENYVIHGNPASYYDRPIAVLTGPGAVSSGDQVALRMKFHPRARFFGKSTATALNAPLVIDSSSGYVGAYGHYDAYLVSDPENYLTHDEFLVDESVWLEPDDVARGVDTVVEAAVRWIAAQRPRPFHPSQLMLRDDRH